MPKIPASIHGVDIGQVLTPVLEALSPANNSDNPKIIYRTNPTNARQGKATKVTKTFINNLSFPGSVCFSFIIFVF